MAHPDKQKDVDVTCLSLDLCWKRKSLSSLLQQRRSSGSGTSWTFQSPFSCQFVWRPWRRPRQGSCRRCRGCQGTCLRTRCRPQWLMGDLMAVVFLVTFISLAGFSAAVEVEDAGVKDSRFTGYKELRSQTSNFEHAGLVGYTQLMLDEARNQILVGGKDVLFRLSLDDLSQKEAAEWASNANVTAKCSSTGQSEENCHNFLRVLLLHQADRVLACGTNSFDPLCTWRSAENLSHVKEEFSGRAICPFDPRHNTTALMTDNGDIYAATVIDILARDPAINRKGGPSPILRTEQHNSKWLNEPNFVSTYEFGNFVYYFFRETAVEYINCGKKVFSRAARVCKTDRGGTIFLEGKWTSFHKARLNCSLPGDFPFYFDELQSTFYSEEEKLVYAIFTTPPNSIAGSAVCAYNMTSFEDAFNGPFKHQESAMSAWMRHDNDLSETRKCNSDTGGMKRSSEKSTNHLVMGMKYQMMDQAVQPVTRAPMVMREQERWTHIVVDHVTSKTHDLDVFFLATEDGKIQKMVNLPDKSVTCLLEEIKIVPNGRPRPVKAMKLSSLKGAIYLSTDGNVLKVPVQRCSNFSDSRKCLAARDPYCGWNTMTEKCTTAPGGNPRAEYWQQEITDCPSTEYQQDGGWSRWTPWSKCQNVGGDSTMDQCLCRSRSCDNPQPINGGSPCFGASMEVANCTVHGEWTDWSEWSACSQTCGFAIRVRKRQCGNPPPKYGGRVCAGSATETQYCNGSPECSLPPVDGNWSLWSGWSACTKECNGGIQTRRRSCNQPEPSRSGVPCEGNKQEWRMCNTQDCEEVTRISPWTEWIQTNRTTGGYFEQRFRFTCRASVPKRKLIKTSFAKSQARFCHNNGHGCQTSASTTDVAAGGREDGWSAWAEWSACSALCDGGMQWRNRTCGSPTPPGGAPECQGHGREGRECNTYSCQEDISDGEWSAWSSCSVSSGVRYRHQSKPGKDTSPYLVEVASCDDTMAPGVPEVRQSKSGRESPSNASDIRRQGVLYLVIVGVVSFTIGGLACVGLCLYIQHNRKQQRKKVAWTTNVALPDLTSTHLNNLSRSRDSLDMRIAKHFDQLSQHNIFDSFRKGTLTVSEASTLKRDAMWTNLNINDL